MMSAEARLQELNIQLPPAGKAAHQYVRARAVGDLLYIAGHSPRINGEYPALGKLGEGVSLEQGQICAHNCVLNCLASARDYLGTLDRVTAVVKVMGYVASAPDFTDQPLVMNAASSLLVDIFGEVGVHARTSVGVAVLPGDIPVEVDMILAVSS